MPMTNPTQAPNHVPATPKAATSGCFAIKVLDCPAGVAKGVDLVDQVFVFRAGGWRLSRLILAYMLGEPDGGMQPGKGDLQVMTQDRA